MVTTLTRVAIGGSDGMASPDLFDMDLLFNGVDTHMNQHKLTEASYKNYLLYYPW